MDVANQIAGIILYTIVIFLAGYRVHQWTDKKKK